MPLSDIKKYIKQQGYKPNRFGYPSRALDIAQKGVASLLPPVWIGFILNKLSKGNNLPEVIAIGRGKSLPKEQQLKGNRDCKLADNFGPIYVNYDGKLQYCMYTCHDGFMNISELRDVHNKQDAITLILERLSQDVTFQDILKLGTCYFADEIRKKSY